MTFRAGTSVADDDDDDIESHRRKPLTDEARVALDEIANGHGRLTRSMIFAAAKRDTKNPLRPYFTWDLKEAALKRNLDEAGDLLRRYKIMVIVDEVEVILPRFVRDPEAEKTHEEGYIRLDYVTKSPKDSKAVLKYELNRARAHMYRACAIGSSMKIGGEYKKILRMIEKLLEGFE